MSANDQIITSEICSLLIRVDALEKASSAVSPHNAFSILSKSLRNMSEWYSFGYSRIAEPILALQCSLSDTALAAEKAEEGLVWIAPDEFEKFNPGEVGNEDS